MTATERTLHSFILKMQAKTKRTIVNLILFCGVSYFAEKYQYYDCELRVVPTHNRMAFDIIDGPDYETRHTATAVFVRYRNLCKEGRLLTYVNDSRPFGPTIRHANNISEGFIRLLDLTAGQKYPAVFSILPDGAHQFEILNIE